MKLFEGTSPARHGVRCLISIVFSCFLASQAFGQTLPGNALPGDQHWDNQFGYVGASDQLYTINLLGGMVYIGGNFTAAGNTAANSIAGYDGTNWFQLNNGVSGSLALVESLANDGTNLYVGGAFTDADKSGAINIARWDGSSFHPLAGGPPNSIVTAIKIVGPNFYVGGEFTTNGIVPVNCIAQWTGTSWQPLGAGLTGGTVFAPPVAEALEYDGTYLYAGGRFTQAGTVAANNIARWDGTSWSAMGSGLSGTVWALCSLNGNLYAGGSFTNSALGITNLACWNGSSWSAVGLGPDKTVAALVTDGTNLYVGGFFTHINGMAANRVAMWNSSTWSVLGTGIHGTGVGQQGINVYRMALDSQGRLFVAGNFTEAGSVGTSHVAGWNGTNWFALGATTSKGMSHSFGVVRGLFSDGVNIYAGGAFTEAGSQIVEQVARWDGTNWWPMGASPSGALPESGPVAFTIPYDGNLYAGGYFTNIGPYAVNHVGYWNGTSWNDIGGTDGGVEAMAYDGNYLWVGGAFTNVGVADGTGYNSPGLGQYQFGWAVDYWVTGGSQFVAALAWDGINNNMYAGGNFTSAVSFAAAAPVPVSNIAVLNETTELWSPLGSGVNGPVNAILVTNGVVYVGGSFTTAGGVSVNNIAKWNGTAWSALGSGVTNPNGNPNVNALAMIGNTLYVAGSFTNAGSVYAAGLAAWNGTNWSGLGSGLYFSTSGSSGSANALIANGNDLYVGGPLNWAGNKPSAFIGHWNSQLNYYPPPHPFITREAWLPGKQFQFRLAGTSGESYILQGSTNFVQWTSLLTNSATLYDFTDTNASHYPYRFYRAVLGP